MKRPRTDYMLTKLWSDPEINARFFLQAKHLFADEVFGADSNNEFWARHLFPVMHKLTAMKYHLETYKRIESRLFMGYVKSFQHRPSDNAECFELIVHFEAFMLQMKSSLDMLIKIMRLVPLRDGRNVKTRGYGDEGNQLIKSLREEQEQARATSTAATQARDDVFISRLGALIELAEEARDGWLTAAVEIRDQIAHTEGARSFVFTPVQLPNGRFYPKKPTFKHRGEEKKPVDLMDRVYGRAIEFHQDFLARAMHLGTDLPFRLERAAPGDVAYVDERHRGFLKWSWHMNGENVRGLFRT